MTTDSKLNANTVWLFALATLVLAIGVTYLVPHLTGALSPKAWGAIYAVVFGAGAAGAAYLTSAGGVAVGGSFAVSSLGLGIFYYVVVARAMAAAAESLGANGDGASALGSMSGLMFAVAFFAVALAASLGGSMFGRKLRMGLGGALAARR